jgi:hypothetical protein
MSPTFVSFVRRLVHAPQFVHQGPAALDRGFLALPAFFLLGLVPSGIQVIVVHGRPSVT